jgi:triosephosphate isomerase
LLLVIAMNHSLIAGNWKMNGAISHLSEIVAIAEAADSSHADAVICMPATLLDRAIAMTNASNLKIGAQDCHCFASGAYTGDISAEMLHDIGASYVIVGHSERRAAYSETDATVATKAEAAYRAGITAIICVGETEQQRERGETIAVVGTQLAGSVPSTATPANTAVAYEPVWAIGTGKVPTEKEIAEVHSTLRALLIKRFGEDGNAIRLLYGGSVKPSNASTIFAIPGVDGALIGGASLKASDFSSILAAAR